MVKHKLLEVVRLHEYEVDLKPSHEKSTGAPTSTNFSLLFLLARKPNWMQQSRSQWHYRPRETAVSSSASPYCQNSCFEFVVVRSNRELLGFTERETWQAELLNNHFLFVAIKTTLLTKLL